MPECLRKFFRQAAFGIRRTREAVRLPRWIKTRIRIKSRFGSIRLRRNNPPKAANIPFRKARSTSFERLTQVFCFARPLFYKKPARRVSMGKNKSSDVRKRNIGVRVFGDFHSFLHIPPFETLRKYSVKPRFGLSRHNDFRARRREFIP